MELTDMEKLAIAQAFVNQVGDMVKTKDAHNLRGRVDEMMKEKYLENGGKSFDVKLLGQKVGTYYLTISKPTESREKMELLVEDGEAFWNWALAHDMVQIKIAEVKRLAETTGEVPDGCKANVVTVPGDAGGEVTRTTLKVDSCEVAKALGPMLNSASELLLEGAFDD